MRWPQRCLHWTLGTAPLCHGLLDGDQACCQADEFLDHLVRASPISGIFHHPQIPAHRTGTFKPKKLEPCILFSRSFISNSNYHPAILERKDKVSRRAVIMTATGPKKFTTYSSEVNLEQTTVFKALTLSDFVPNQGCETAYWKFAQPSLVGWDPGYNLHNPQEIMTRCHPPAVTGWWNQATRPDEDVLRTVISIGPIVCPVPYTTATIVVNSLLRTMVVCCPRYVPSSRLCHRHLPLLPRCVQQPPSCHKN